MELKIKTPSNYLAKVVKLENEQKHPNADKLKIFNIDFQSCITNLEYNNGDVCIYFPILAKINPSLISYINGFQDRELNKDKTQKGYMSSKSVVKAANLRSSKSQGLLLKIETVENWLEELLGKTIAFSGWSDFRDIINKEFDYFDDVMICEKYVNPREKSLVSKPKQVNKLKELMIDGQFNFHYETSHLVKNLNKLNKDSEIVITQKLHGSSCILSRVLVKRKLSWKDKIAKFFKISVIETEYKGIYSSGKPKSNLVKGIEGNFVNGGISYYSENIWAKAYNDYKTCIEPGISVYGELLNESIQKGYDYKKLRPVDKDYTLVIYRITRTNDLGFVDEFSWNQVEQYCKKYNLQTVPIEFKGKLIDYWSLIDERGIINSESFINQLKEQFLEKDCKYCENKLPAEGICIRTENPHDCFKLKSFKFLQKESDDVEKEVVNIEDEQ